MIDDSKLIDTTPAHDFKSPGEETSGSLTKEEIMKIKNLP